MTEIATRCTPHFAPMPPRAIAQPDARSNATSVNLSELPTQISLFSGFLTLFLRGFVKRLAILLKFGDVGFIGVGDVRYVQPCPMEMRS